eukprot:8032630-Ditylum_brightwellii.AAC.1
MGVPKAIWWASVQPRSSIRLSSNTKRFLTTLSSNVPKHKHGANQSSKNALISLNIITQQANLTSCYPRGNIRCLGYP